MLDALRELGLYVLIAVAAALSQAAWLLGVGLDAPVAVAAALALVAVGTVALVPRDGRAVAGFVGAAAVIVAGFAVPIYAARALSPGATLPASIAAAGVVLVAAVLAIRLTTFRPSIRALV